MNIKRARGHRLYTTCGKRIIDLSMDNGRAVIGHRPNGLSLTIKNSIDRGIYASYDSIYVNRLIKYIKNTFSEYKHVTILKYEEKIESFFNTTISDPLIEDCSNSLVAYWRPFIESPKCNNLVLLYPLPGLNSVSILISKEKLELESDNISPILLSGILRSFYDYDIEYKKFNKDDFLVYGSIKDSILKPPYLILNKDNAQYKKLYEEGLKSDILINDKTPILVLSNEFSKGEQQKILTLLD